MRYHACVVVLIMACAVPVNHAAQRPSDQPPTPTFRGAVDDVEVDVVVTNAKGDNIRDLKTEDFQIFEDGKPQTLSQFVPIDIPGERATPPLVATHAIEPDVRTNEHPFAGRMYVMVLDAAHTLPQNTPGTRAAARSFINDRLGANDLMAVVGVGGVGGGAGTGQEFTNNKRLLLAAVDSFRGDAPRSATLTRMQDAIRTEPQRNATRAPGQRAPSLNDLDVSERERNAHALVGALTDIANWFSTVHGLKKSILLFSEGISYDTHDVFQNGGHNSAAALQASIQELVRAAAKANVVIYAIDPRGLQALAGASVDVQGVANESILDEQALQQESRFARQSLENLSDMTGGFAAVNTNRMGDAFDRIVSENSGYYLLGYYPPNPKRDGKFHSIDVRVTRPGVRVRFRQGYADPFGKAPAERPRGAELAGAIQSPMPISGLTMMVFATPFKGSARNASVLVGIELRGRDLTMTPNGRIDIVCTAIDQQGKSHAEAGDTLTLNLQPQAKERVAQTGMRVLKRLNLTAGRYQLRVAARDEVSGAVGSVFYDLDVPDFSQPKLAMSGPVVTSAAGLALPTVAVDPALRGVLPGPPMAARKFARDDQIALFVDVYDNDATRIHNVDVTISMTSDSGRVVLTNDEVRSTAEFGGKPGAFGISKPLVLSGFEPGVYTLRVEARSRLSAEVAASRELQIQVAEP